MTNAGQSRVATRVRELPPSGIRRFFELVIGVPDVLSLGVGEPDFATPWTIREQAIFDLEKGRTTYTSNYGLRELRIEIARMIERRFGVSYEPDREIVVTVGASEAIDLALRAILNPGERVVVPEPCYVSYVPSVVLAGGEAVRMETLQEDGFRPTVERLGAVCTPGTRAILLNYPNNPTGATLREDHLAELASFAVERDLLVLSDEIYAELTYDGNHAALAAQPGMRERTLLISGFSKTFAMTGWRLGYACGPADVIEAMVKIHQYTMLCAPTVSQYAALEALRDSWDDVARMREQYDMRRKFLTKALNEAGLPTLLPEGAFYVFANITPTGLDSETFCGRLLEEEKVAVVPGTAFGPCGEGFVRASYASSFECIEQAAERIAAFARRLRGAA